MPELSLRRLRASWLTLLLLATAPLSVAGTLDAPPLTEGQFVYSIPAGFIPEKLSANGLAELQRTAKGLHYPFYIVFVKELPTQTGRTTEDDTERAIVGLADDWSKDPKFIRNRSTLYLVSYGPGDRKYKMLPAPLWRVELGLENNALKPFNEIFKSTARRDPQTALIRVMRAFDRHVYDNFDPKRKAERAEQARREELARKAEEKRRAEQARIAYAHGRLNNEITRLQVALSGSPEFFPADASEHQARLQRALRAQGTNVEQMNLLADELEQHTGSLEGHIASKVAERESEERKRQGTILATIAGAIFLIVLVVARKKSLQAKRQELDQRLRTWREWITQARQRYYLFDEHRERAPHLKQFGGRTREMYELTSKEIDSIITGIEAIGAHLDALEAKARQASAINQAPLDQALHALDKPFTFETGQISNKLFEPETKTIQVTPSSFFESLSSRYDAAIENWQNLNDAVTQSLQLPDSLFPHTGLDALLKRAQEHGIPDRWLAKHPLMGDSSSDQSLYSKVNECRLTDPYAYAEQIEDLKAREAEVESDLNRLIEALHLASSNKLDRVEGLEGTVLSPEDNPQFTLDSANVELSRLTTLLSTAATVEDFEAQATKTNELFESTRRQLEEARNAIAGALQVAEQASAALGSCQVLQAEAMLNFERVSRDHNDVSSVANAREAARQFLEAGKRDLEKANAKLNEGRHLASWRDAQQALSQFSQATAKLTAANALCTELDSVKARFEQKLAEMESLREDALRRVRHYGGSYHLVGDFNRPTYSGGRADFGYLYGLLQQQEQHWTYAVRQAEIDYEEELRRQREEEDRLRRAEQSSLFSSSSGSSSSSSFSFGSSDSGSSGGSFSSGGSGSSSSGSDGGSW